jgi:hypothetical protein
MGKTAAPARLAIGLAVATLSSVLAAPPPATTADVVILARDRLFLGRASRHVTGQLVTNSPGGLAKVHALFRAGDNTQIIADTISVFQLYEGPFLYDVYTNLLMDNGRTQVAGTGPAAITLPLFAYPPPVSFAPGTLNITVRNPTPMTLPPGDYGNIRLRPSGTLYFTGGTYNIRSLRGALNARLYFYGPTTLNVAERLSSGTRSVIGPLNEATLSGRCLVINYAGTRRVRFGNVSNITATVNAPLAKLRLGGSGEYRGNFVAADVRVGGNAVLEAAPPLASPCM